MVSTGAAIRKLVSASDSFIGSFHWTKPIGSMFSFLKNALAAGYWAPDASDRTHFAFIGASRSQEHFERPGVPHGVSVN